MKKPKTNIEKVLDKFARSRGGQHWNSLGWMDEGHIVIDTTEAKELATLAFEQGKLAERERILTKFENSSWHRVWLHDQIVSFLKKEEAK